MANLVGLTNDPTRLKKNIFFFGKRINKIKTWLVQLFIVSFKEYNSNSINKYNACDYYYDYYYYFGVITYNPPVVWAKITLLTRDLKSVT